MAVGGAGQMVWVVTLLGPTLTASLVEYLLYIRHVAPLTPSSSSSPSHCPEQLRGALPPARGPMAERERRALNHGLQGPVTLEYTWATGGWVSKAFCSSPRTSFSSACRDTQWRASRKCLLDKVGEVPCPPQVLTNRSSSASTSSSSVPSSSSSGSLMHRLAIFSMASMGRGPGGRGKAPARPGSFKTPQPPVSVTHSLTK